MARAVVLTEPQKKPVVARLETPAVPAVMSRLIAAIEAKGGRQLEGLFRVTGAAGEIKQLLLDLDRGDLAAIDHHMNVTVLATALKQWLASLQQPLIPYILYSKAIEAAGEPGAVAAVVAALPPAHRAALAALAAFLHSLLADEAHTNMGAANLAVVFAPNLIISDLSVPLGAQQAALILRDAKVAPQFVEELIRSPPAMAA